MDSLGVRMRTPSAQDCRITRSTAVTYLGRPRALRQPRTALAGKLPPAAVALAPRRVLKPQRVCAVATADAMASSDGSDMSSLAIDIDNRSDPEFTIISIEGKGQGTLLATLSSSLQQYGINVNSAFMNNDEGIVQNVFKVTTNEGGKVPESQWPNVRDLIVDVASTSKRSTQPAIYGMVAMAEVERLRTGAATSESSLTTSDAVALELTAAEMAQAAAEFVALEKEMEKLKAKGADSGVIALKFAARQEAAALLERRMAAMEAVLAARRMLLVAPEAPKSAADQLAEQMKAAVTGPPQPSSTGPAAGSGYEILLQAFNWESHKKPYYQDMRGLVGDWAKQGFTSLWLPPPSDSVSPQGYLPRDLYDLNSNYGSEQQLRELIQVCHENNLKVIADIVINHRCAHNQDSQGRWNKYGGRLAWDQRAICNNNPAWGGQGNHKTGDDYPAAPNIDHTQDFVQNDLIQWLQYLRKSIGFDGWRFDYVRGYNGQYAKIYTDATVPEMSFGEYWDTCEYTDGVLNYNQDAHRQRTVNWCDQTGGTCAAFDFTTKGILQEALGRNEMWRLVDAQGRPPGFLGMWPSRAITFIDNHDTGSTLNHWPFPNNHLCEGYAYIITHPGTPCIFLDHLYQEAGGLRKAILELIEIRKSNGIHCRSVVKVRKATGDVYAASIDDKIAMKIGRGDWSPNAARLDVGQKRWEVVSSGQGYAVWTAVF